MELLSRSLPVQREEHARAQKVAAASAGVGIFVAVLLFVYLFCCGVFCFGCWLGLLGFFLRLSFSSCSDPGSLSLPRLRRQVINRKNWKKGDRSEAALLEQVCVSWESCGPLSQGVGEGAWSHTQKT